MGSLARSCCNACLCKIAISDDAIACHPLSRVAAMAVSKNEASSRLQMALQLHECSVRVPIAHWPSAAALVYGVDQPSLALSPPYLGSLDGSALRWNILRSGWACVSCREGISIVPIVTRSRWRNTFGRSGGGIGLGRARSHPAVLD